MRLEEDGGIAFVQCRPGALQGRNAAVEGTEPCRSAGRIGSKMAMQIDGVLDWESQGSSSLRGTHTVPGATDRTPGIAPDHNVSGAACYRARRAPCRYGDRARQRRPVVVLVTVSVMGATVVNLSIMNVALPTLGRQLSASNAQLEWIVASYSLTFAGFLLAAGSLADRGGPKACLDVGSRDLRALFSDGRGHQHEHRAHRGPGGNGLRGGDDHADHAFDHHQRLPDRGRPAKCDRRLGGHGHGRGSCGAAGRRFPPACVWAGLLS